MDYRSRPQARPPPNESRFGPSTGGNLYGGFPPIDYNDRGTLDGRAQRSRSLDLRRELEEEDFGGSRNRFGSQALVPYDRAAVSRRNYDYDRDIEFDTKGANAGYETRRFEGGGGGGAGYSGSYWAERGERTSPRSGLNRGMARSQEWYPKGAPGSGHVQSSPRFRPESSRPVVTGAMGGGISPRSAGSRKQQHLSVNVERGKGVSRERTIGRGGLGFNGTGRRDDYSPRSAATREEYNRETTAGNRKYESDWNTSGGAAHAGTGGTRRFDQEWASSGNALGTTGGGHRNQYGSSYHHERYSGGNGAAAAGFTKRGSPGKPGLAGAPGAPRQHYKYKCCCLTFTWPPWSYEPVEPPHPIYTRTI